MIKNIVVPTDFSTCSIHALRYAAQLAEKLSLENLYIIHALPEPITYGDVGISSTATDLAIEREIEIDKNFITIKKAVPKLNEIKHSFLKKPGHVVDAISAFCKKTPIDLIIMGTKGASGIDAMIMGTNTHAMIKEIRLPVMVIPKQAQYKPIANIALASDYKMIDNQALGVLKQFVWIFGSHLHIIHVGESNHLAESEVKHAKRLESYVKHIPHEYHFVINTDIEEGIEDYITQHNIDLITLIPRKHSLFERVFGQEVSKKLVYHTQTPLLTLPG